MFESIRGRIRPGIAALGVLLAAAVALRVFAILAYWPAGLGKHDSAAYIRTAHSGLDLDTLDPSGYPVFLRLVHTLSSQLVFTIAVQQLLGLGGRVRGYPAGRRPGRP